MSFAHKVQCKFTTQGYQTKGNTSPSTDSRHDGCFTAVILRMGWRSPRGRGGSVGRDRISWRHPLRGHYHSGVPPIPQAGWGRKVENRWSSQVSRNRRTASARLDDCENKRGEEQHRGFCAVSSCSKTCTPTTQGSTAEKLQETQLPRDSCDPKWNLRVGMRLTHNGDPHCGLKWHRNKMLAITMYVIPHRGFGKPESVRRLFHSGITGHFGVYL